MPGQLACEYPGILLSLPPISLRTRGSQTHATMPSFTRILSIQIQVLMLGR